MSPARMLVEWAIPWLVLYIGLSVETAGENTRYHHFRFVSKTEVQANFSFVQHPRVLPHSDRKFCSAWGNYHFKTFDGEFVQVPSTCTYTFVRQCKGSYEEFNIGIQRQETSGVPVIKVSLKLDGMMIQLSQSSIRVDAKRWVWVSDNVAESKLHVSLASLLLLVWLCHSDRMVFPLKRFSRMYTSRQIWAWYLSGMNRTPSWCVDSLLYALIVIKSVAFGDTVIWFHVRVHVPLPQ